MLGPPEISQLVSALAYQTNRMFISTVLSVHRWFLTNITRPLEHVSPFRAPVFGYTVLLMIFSVFSTIAGFS